MEYFVLRQVLTNGHPDLLATRISWQQYMVLRVRCYWFHQGPALGIFGILKRPRGSFRAI
jgi:hypothetical protein